MVTLDMPIDQAPVVTSRGSEHWLRHFGQAADDANAGRIPVGPKRFEVPLWRAISRTIGEPLSQDGVDSNGSDVPQPWQFDRILADHPPVDGILETIGHAIPRSIEAGVINVDQLDLVADSHRRSEFWPLIAQSADTQ